MTLQHFCSHITKYKAHTTSRFVMTLHFRVKRPLYFVKFFLPSSTRFPPPRTSPRPALPDSSIEQESFSGPSPCGRVPEADPRPKSETPSDAWDNGCCVPDISLHDHASLPTVTSLAISLSSL